MNLSPAELEAVLAVDIKRAAPPAYQVDSIVASRAKSLAASGAVTYDAKGNRTIVDRGAVAALAPWLLQAPSPATALPPLGPNASQEQIEARCAAELERLGLTRSLAAVGDEADDLGFDRMTREDLGRVLAPDAPSGVDRDEASRLGGLYAGHDNHGAQGADAITRALEDL